MRTPAWLQLGASSLLFSASIAAAARVKPRPEIAHPNDSVDVIGRFEEATLAAKAGRDTTWIADWTFDGDGACDDTGWAHIDGRILNDGTNDWWIVDDYSGLGGIQGRAAALGRHDPCWDYPDGVGNDWDRSIRISYRGRGASRLSFDYLLDADPEYEYGIHMSVELDRNCDSEALDYELNPLDHPSLHRSQIFTDYRRNFAGRFESGELPTFGEPESTHCVYIRFVSDYGTAEEGVSSILGAGLVVDNIRIIDGAISVDEDFEAELDPDVELVNSAPAIPFGEWARLYPHATDNEPCTENPTCAWIWTDPTRTAVLPGMGFGPGDHVVRNWLDDSVISPWASLGSTPGALGTVVTFREFPGNPYGYGRIVRGCSVRTKFRVENTDTPAPGDSIDCIGPWQPEYGFLNALSTFQWVTRSFDFSPYVDPSAREIQVRLRVLDYELIYCGQFCYSGYTGPGPYIDRVRIGRRFLSGPVIDAGIDSRSQPQDAFATFRNGIVPGEHFSPDVDRLGSAAFSSAADLGAGTSPNLISGDSIWARVVDARDAGGVVVVDWYGAVVSGPHAGKAPPPWSVGASGFFHVPADSVRSDTGVAMLDLWFVDLDDEYFRGGDVLLSFWTAADAAGGFTSYPEGMEALPASVAAAEAATGGLFEVSFLPNIDWDAGYRARIASHPSGKVEPTQEERAGSSQTSCLLYYQLVNNRRRSGDLNRTSFMYTLDQLGYRGHYDVYDVQGYGNTNNQLGGRATVAQAGGYALIVQDAGRLAATILPDGSNLETEKIDQAQWYRDWLRRAGTSPAGRATLWLLGENLAQERALHPLLAVDMGVQLVATNQSSGLAPEVGGQGTFAWDDAVADFTGDVFRLEGACPTVRDYDALGSSGTAVVTHRFRGPKGVGSGAAVMNRDPALHWNTILMSFNWFDVRTATDPEAAPTRELAGSILNAALPGPCERQPVPSGSWEGPPEAPVRTALFQNYPNPFNPETRIHFDLGRPERVRLSIHDASGRLVRELLAGELPRGPHQVDWDGRDGGGRRASSGVYFYRLEAGDESFVRRMVVLK